MAAPFALTYEAPLGPVPDWLSYRVSPTATLVLPFTVETLAPNGAPTAITGQATVTRYETQLLQLPVTVSLVPVPSGQEQISLGSEYTTAGGDGPTIARVVGETELITLGPTTTSPTRGQTQGTAESARSSAATAPTAALSSVELSLSSALASASVAGQSSLVSLLSSELSAVSSAVSVASSPGTATSSSMTLTSTSSTNPSSSASTTPGSLSPNRLDSLTPSQLAAAIAAPICFFFLVVFLLILLCCCIRRRRRRKRDQDNMFEGGLAGGGGSWGRTTRAPSGDWDWVEPTIVGDPNSNSRGPGSRTGGYFFREEMGGSRGSSPFRRDEGRGGEGGRGEGEVSLLAGGGRLENESEGDRGEEDDEEGDDDDDAGEIGTAVMMRASRGSRRGKPAPLGLGIASSLNSGGERRSPSLPERAAATLNAGLRRISGGRLGSSPEPEDYAYEQVGAPTRTDLDLPPSHEHEMVQRSMRPYWDPYKPSPTTPEFPILAPVISATSSDEPRRPNEAEYYSGNSTSPDRDDVRRANLGLANLTNESRWSEGGSPRTGENDDYDDEDEGDDEAEHESTEMLASSREDAPLANKKPSMIGEGDWLRGRPALVLPPLLRPPSDVSLSQYSQSDAGLPRRTSDQGQWLPPPRFDDRERSRENSGGSVASDLSMGNDKLSVNELFFSAPRWTGTARNPAQFPTSTISPIIPSGLVMPLGNLTPPLSSSSSGSSSRYADAPISQPHSSSTRASFHTPKIGSSRSPSSFPSRESHEENEDSPMVYSVTPDPNTRTKGGSWTRSKTGRTRPDSAEVLENAAKSYERERGGDVYGTSKRRKRIEEEWKEIRLVEEEPSKRSPYEAPFSNLTPLSSPLLPSPSTPPPATPSRGSSSSSKDQRPFLLPPHATSIRTSGTN